MNTIPNKPARPADPTLKTADDVLHIIDTNTITDRVTEAGAVLSGKRVHHMIVDGVIRPYVFEHGKPLAVEYAIAQRFLEVDAAFKLVDEKGNVLPYVRLPKQPHQLQAGEALKLDENETIARFNELTTGALQRRAVQMLGGERFARNEDRAAIIAFIIQAKKERDKSNISKESDGPKDDEWNPDRIDVLDEAVA